jgi:hypothetical protein
MRLWRAPPWKQTPCKRGCGLPSLPSSAAFDYVYGFSRWMGVILIHPLGK